MTDGQTLADGRYVLGALLGRGGMAAVRGGRDHRLDRPVAVKQLSAHLAADPVAQQRFRREAQAAASLNHPAIASVFDTGEEPDPVTGLPIPYIVMELVEGSTLREVLREGGGPLLPARALLIIQGVLDALAHSHAAGIVHRDIKPANVMLTPTGGVKVMDFGIARAMDDTSASLTQTATVIGTAQYLSPEQASGESADLRSDLYAVGCLLFELLVGRPPFVGETPISIAYQQVREAPVPPSRLNPDLSPSIDAVVLKALAKHPDERYQSARAMRSDVGLLLTELDGYVAPLLAPPPAAMIAEPAGPEAPVAGSPARGSRLARRAFLVAVSVFLLLGLGAFGLYRVLTPNRETSASVEVPDVVGRTRAGADARLRAAGLVARFDEVAGEAGTGVGTVTKQTPEARAAVAAGSVVTLELSTGPATARIPDDLVGRDVQDAKRELEAAGFTKVRSEPAKDPGDAPAGTVLSVDPREGRSVDLDEAVVLRYAPGPDGAATAGQPTRRSSTRSSSPPPTVAAPAPAPTGTTEQPTSSAPTSPEPSRTGTTGPPSATAPPTTSASPQPEVTRVEITKRSQPTTVPEPPGQ